MLEKTQGVTLVTKLRAILLLEVDFNASNKIMYGMRMMSQAREHQLILNKIYSEKNCMADDGTLTKTLFYDIMHQASIPAAITLVDASNCYNRIAHTIALLVFQALSIPGTAIESMLNQEHEVFLVHRLWHLSKRKLTKCGHLEVKTFHLVSLILSLL